MKTQETVLWSKEDVESWVKTLLEEEISEPLRVTIKNYKVNKSVNQNSLYWMWLEYLARVFTENKNLKGFYDKDDMHNICRHLHLGYDDTTYNTTTIKGQLKSTTKLDQGEMFEYMTRIDEWAAKINILLPRPSKNEFETLKQAQGGTNGS